MALDLTGLSTYTDETSGDLIKRSVMKGRTIDYISMVAGIKSAQTINTINNEVNIQAGGCSNPASGDTVLEQRVLNVAKLNVVQTWCIDDLEDYYTQTMLNPGSYHEDLPFSGILAEDMIAKLQKENEMIAWQGDTLGSGNLSRADGLLKIIDAAVGVVTGTTLALDAANIIDAVDEMIAAIPEDAIDSDDLTVFMSYASYRIYANALRDTNLFAYTGAENQGGDFMQMHPGTNVMVMAVGGLNGLVTPRAVLAEASNLYSGTDLANDFEQFDLFYDKSTDKVKLNIKYKLGFQVAFPERIVISA
jgi:hypothetical protein